MVKVTVCVRFRPLSASEKRLHGDSTCIQALDTQSFTLKDEKEEDVTFTFDKVFYQDSDQVEIYDFLAMPIIEGSVNAINGTIITYGQTGAGKTYSMEGLGVLDDEEDKKGLLPRTVGGIFECLGSSVEMIKWTVKLSMVKTQKVIMLFARDLFDLSKDNIQIKESKSQGVFLCGATEIPIRNSTEALRCLNMNLASSRSHCVYIFLVQQESTKDEIRLKTGKIVLVDLAGSEKAERSGACGIVLEEAKSINKSLSALGNVINALTTGKVNHIPYRDCKLTRILQDALGGNSKTALLCCCSPSPTNASESLSTLRAKLIKAPPRSNHIGAKDNTEQISPAQKNMEQIIDYQAIDFKRERILNKVRRIFSLTYCFLESIDDFTNIFVQLKQNLSEENVEMLSELFMLEGIFFCPQSTDEIEAAIEDVSMKTISALEGAVEELKDINTKLMRENEVLNDKLSVALNRIDQGVNVSFFGKGIQCLASYLPSFNFSLRKAVA
ncbi:hypothetical protein Cni_G01616 [Canna indica]|uniref:Kinesin-like protein n=1 Tax=Canna indica TaxID=4628 RepID=A0AAQ3JPU8_9LILI|nr:hypothetical protein Cni_G01616 [Canna indica]